MRPPRLILSRPDRLGDVVISTSALRPLRQAVPKAEIHLLLNQNLCGLFQSHPGIDGLIPAPDLKGRTFLQRVLWWKRRLREADASAIVHLHPLAELHLGSWLAGIPTRIGYRRKAAVFLTETIPYRRHLGSQHEAACNFGLLDRLGVALPSVLDPWIEGGFPGRRQLASRYPDAGIDHRFAVLHPYAWGEKPRWPEESYGAIARTLAEDHGFRILIAGGSADASTITKIRRAAGPVGPMIHDLSGQTSLPELTGLLAAATLVVSRDTGPAHLAAALGTPTVCLMGQCDPIHSPTRWRPLGPRVITIERDLAALPREKRQDRWNRCFAAIRTEEVLDAARKLGVLPPTGSCRS